MVLIKRQAAKAKSPLVEPPSQEAPLKTKQERTTKDYIKAVLNEVTAESPFLQQEAPAKNLQSLGLFNRSEIRLGKQVGKGAFSVVHEIESFDLEPELSATMKSKSQQIREKYRDGAIDSNGLPKFVIKHLKKELLNKPDEFSLAASDMAVEAAFLIRMRHKNILSLRGFPASGVSALDDGHDGFFLILDRLTHTLDEQIEHWREKGSGDERSKIEYSRQLASALKYLHSHRIVFRDLKPQNLGFDQQGRLQLFDFGLCRELPEPVDEKEQDDVADLSEEFKATDVFRMSGVGTRRYMAPEVVLDLGYNCKADVYGWAIIVWELFTLAKPYSSYNKRDHKRLVCSGGERPPLTEDEWFGTSHEVGTHDIPQGMADILSMAWEEQLLDRLDAEEACSEMDLWMQSRRKPRRNNATEEDSSAASSKQPRQRGRMRALKILSRARRNATSNSIMAH